MLWSVRRILGIVILGRVVIPRVVVRVLRDIEVIRAVSWVVDVIRRMRNLRDLVLAAEFVNTDFMTPTGLHPAIVLVAEGLLLEGDDAGTWGLEHTWAFVETGRAVIVVTLAIAGLSTPVWSIFYLYICIMVTAAIAAISRTITRFVYKGLRASLGQESIGLLDSSNHLLVLKLDCHAYRDKQASHRVQDSVHFVILFWFVLF